MNRRTDGIERTNISAHVDRDLVRHMEKNNLKKSEMVEKGLRIVLEREMDEGQLARKYKEEIERKQEKVEKIKDEIEEIHEKAKKTLGTTLDDYLEKHDPKDHFAKKRQEFIEDKLAGYIERADGNDIDPKKIANSVYDVILKREYGLTGANAENFVRKCLHEMDIQEDFDYNS